MTEYIQLFDGYCVMLALSLDLFIESLHLCFNT